MAFGLFTRLFTSVGKGGVGKIKSALKLDSLSLPDKDPA